MLLNLKQLFSGQEERMEFQETLDFSGVEFHEAFPFSSPVSVTGKITGNHGSPILEADVAFSLSVPCDRCTEMIRRDYAYSFRHGLVRSLNQEDDSDFYLVVEEELDLDELIRADILLELPTKYLCSPDCKGLCPLCGQNWNEGSCACETRQIDPRLEVLKQWIEEKPVEEIEGGAEDGGTKE